MSFLSLPTTPSLSPIGFSPIGFKAYASENSRSPASVVLLLLLSFLCAVWKCEQFSLFTSAVTWGIIWAVCSRAPAGRYAAAMGNGRRKGGYGGGIGIGGGAVMLAGSLLLAGVCDRASGVSSPWVKVGIPGAVHFIRASGRVDGPGELPVRGMRRVMLVTVAAAIALQPAFVSNSTLALGCCSVVFSAVALVLLEQSLGDLAEAGTMANVAPVRPGWDGDESWRNCATIGREVGMYLFLGFAGTSLVFESSPLKVWANMGFYDQKTLAMAKAGWLSVKLMGIGLLGVAKWAVIPFVVSRYSVVSVGLLELTMTLLMGIVPTFSSIRLLGVIGAFIGMSTYMAARPGVDRSGVFPNVSFRTRSTQLLTAMLLLALGAGTFIFSNYHNYSAPKARGSPIIASGHPIPKLITEAEARYTAMKARQSKSLPDAITEYRRRYSMNPPPNFDRWYEYAKNRNSVLIDEYDTIYHSLKPFWGLPPSELRKRAREAIGFNDPIGLHDNKLLHAAIRNGAVSIGRQGPDWQKDATKGMMQKFVEFLPDMDLGFNIHDEPRIVVPNDMLSKYLTQAEQTLSQLKRDDATTKNEFTQLSDAERAPVPGFPRTLFNVFAHQPTWSGARQSCPANSPAKSTDLDPADDISRFSVQPLGFISNATEASNICLSPSLSQRHGFFDRPNAFNVAQSLIPIFSQSKVSSFGDILYPSPWYWAGKVTYDETKDMEWQKKKPNLYWRGSTTGGFSRNGGWKRQHRQRVVTVINSNDTAKILVQEHRGGSGDWNVREVKRNSLAQLFDVHFSHVGQCDPHDCDAQREFFKIAPIANQNDAWQWKYLLDIDGNAFSGRYYAFLESHSAVFKQAVFREWHEEWIVPWVHYVPVSMGMEEVVEMMRYFEVEEEGKNSIKKIAEEGRSWAKQVLRNEDFEVWFFRLLLEYGRVLDDNRETIGYLA